MMTKQAELKQKAYQSSLKSRALSVLIYLIDRSNKDLTCFPAIPTMAEQLHVSVSTVKRALHELVDAGYIKKETRFREKNRGQTSNLYILVQPEDVPVPTPITDKGNDDTGLQEIAERSCEVRHITFADIAVKEAEPEVITEETDDEETQGSQEYVPAPEHNTPVHTLLGQCGCHLPKVRTIGQGTEQKLTCDLLFTCWTGVGFSLHPP